MIGRTGSVASSELYLLFENQLLSRHETVSIPLGVTFVVHV